MWHWLLPSTGQQAFRTRDFTCWAILPAPNLNPYTPRISSQFTPYFFPWSFWSSSYAICLCFGKWSFYFSWSHCLNSSWAGLWSLLVDWGTLVNVEEFSPKSSFLSMGNLRSIDIETRHYKEPVISRKQTVVMRLERCPWAGHCCPAVAHQVFVL